MGILPAIRDNAGSYLVALFVAPTSIAAANTAIVVQGTLTAGPGASPCTANAAECISIVGHTQQSCKKEAWSPAVCRDSQIMQIMRSSTLSYWSGKHWDHRQLGPSN